MPQANALSIHAWSCLHRAPAARAVGHNKRNILALIQVIVDNSEIFFVGV
jgi:hypothetical protein